MSEVYNKKYYENYDTDKGKISYEKADEIKAVMLGVARDIYEDFYPKTVLEAGCAMGYFVEGMRDLGVDAYGIDISEYAISHVREDIKPYCAVRSLTEELPAEFPKKFDLIFSCEVFEHLYEEDAQKAIHNLCQICDTFIFVSTPTDIEDPTHLNVRQREYWAKLFAKEGFYHRVDLNTWYAAPYCLVFSRSDNLPRVIEDYERDMRISQMEYDAHEKELEAEKKRLEDQISQLDEQLKQQAKDAEGEIEYYLGQMADYAKLQQEHQRIVQEYLMMQSKQHFETDYNQIIHSASWKLTKPIRVLLNLCKALGRRCKSAGRLFKKGIGSVKKYGIKTTWAQIRDRKTVHASYKAYMKAHLPNEAELTAQRNASFEHPVKFSVIVPLYNTPENFLKEMIESVIAQTYPNWELCMADGSDAQHGNVQQICERYAKKDDRVLYKKLDSNLGIPGNTNACIEMATGDYIALFDHDDLLHPGALYEMMTVIEKDGADFMYTDEVTFKEHLLNPVTLHLKPDFAIDNLRANNYICHFTAFKKTLLDEAGWFRDEYNGSQDYDIILRLTEKAQKIVHIPKVLYYWRSHAGSVSQAIDAKPYCIDSAKRAILAHLERQGLSGSVDVAPRQVSLYRISYDIIDHPLISIIIPNKDHMNDLMNCVNSILNSSTYNNYEIIIVENNSVTKEIFSVYKILERNPKVRVIRYQGAFNYSKINNFGVENAKGDYILLLNNDTEVISPNWLEELLMFAQRKDVGAVGAKLYFPDDSIAHAGIAINICGLAGHIFYGTPNGKQEIGYMGRLTYAQNVTAVTGACLMVKKEKYLEIGGLDEELAVAYNDVEFCLRLRNKGYLNVFTPFAELYHYESKTRGSDQTPENIDRFRKEQTLLFNKSGELIKHDDPYYPRDFRRDNGNFLI